MSFFDLIGEPDVRPRPGSALRQSDDGARCVRESPRRSVGGFILGGRPRQT